MRRATCYCTPNQTLAGEEHTWKFVYSSLTKLPKGAKIRFDLNSQGRDIDWEIPTTNLKKTEKLIYATFKGTTLQAEEIEVEGRFTPLYEFTLPMPLEAGAQFVIILGSKGEKNKGGIRAQTRAERRRPFFLSVDPKGKGHYEDVETISVDIRGNALSQIRILSPSCVVKNKRFDVFVRFEDEFGNLTSHAQEDSLIELSHEGFRDNLKWRIFVPETGHLAIPNLYFNEAGFYRLRLLVQPSKEEFFSPPIRCVEQEDSRIFWGSLHGESDRFDCTENIEACLRHFRDDLALQFYGVSPFSSQEETPQEIWSALSQNVATFNEDERFSAFLGCQWVGEPGSEGTRLFVYAKDQKPLIRHKELKYSTLKKVYKCFSPKELLSIPTFTMAEGTHYDFEHFDAQYERVVEIYNAWGSSECSKKEGNPRPIASPKKSGYTEAKEGSIREALNRNHRFGFVAGGWDDRGIYGHLFDSDQEQYSPGLTAIFSAAQTREGLMEALHQRSCYATTGARMIVYFSIAGVSMGKETNTTEKPGLSVNRHLVGHVAGTTALTKVQIIRNGTVLHTWEPNQYAFEFAFDDLAPLQKVSIDLKRGTYPFSYYYLRVVQQDGHIAWSSPIWVDLTPIQPASREHKKASPQPRPSSPAISDFEEEDESDDEDDFEDEDF